LNDKVTRFSQSPDVESPEGLRTDAALVADSLCTISYRLFFHNLYPAKSRQASSMPAKQSMRRYRTNQYHIRRDRTLSYRDTPVAAWRIGVPTLKRLARGAIQTSLDLRTDRT
jgi:hypothetical protein